MDLAVLPLLAINCKSNDQLIPCVAVIDEDGAFSFPDQAAWWTEFRTQYPSMIFCLLIPNPEGNIGILQTFWLMTLQMSSMILSETMGTSRLHPIGGHHVWP